MKLGFWGTSFAINSSNEEYCSIGPYPKSGNTWFRMFLANYLQIENETGLKSFELIQR